MDERELLELLEDDARRSVADLARLLDASESDVEAAIERLEDTGTIAGYRTVIDWDEVDDERVRASVEVNVQLDRETDYDEIATRIARFPAVTALRLVSGDYDFEVVVEADSMRAVSRFVSDQVAPLPPVTQTVTHYVMESYKEAGVLLDDSDDDDRLSVTP